MTPFEIILDAVISALNKLVARLQSMVDWLEDEIDKEESKDKK